MSAQPVEVTTMDAPRVTIHVGDCRDVLKTLPAKSVHCVITSPPYMGLRKYSDDAREIGLEADVAAYVAALMDVFAEVWRVLRDDGSLFLNLGDSYAGSGKGPTGKHGVGHHEQRQGFHTPARAAGAIRAKSMMLIPERILLALSDAGWIVRDKIVWHKLAPMPSSATDRCTGAWEPVYHLTKQQRYYGDMEAVRQEAASANRPQPTPDMKTRRPNDTDWHDNRYAPGPSGYGVNPAGANLRNVWSLSPAPFDSAALGVDTEHYATYPVELARRCMSIGTSDKGVCSKCGKPWVRVVERESVATQPGRGKAGRDGWGRNDIGAGRNGMFVTTYKDHGWQPSCKCDAPVAPAVVLDPFAGAGTTLLVANRLGRHAIGIELNPKYARLSEARIRADAGMFANVEVIE